jgi:5-methylcytosine-specific restriction endonuclease McrA
MDEHLFCNRCGNFAEIAHHITPHNGDPIAFHEGELEALCKSCHEYQHRRGVTRRVNP